MGAIDPHKLTFCYIIIYIDKVYFLLLASNILDWWNYLLFTFLDLEY